jgi:hypothetical protein
MSLSCFSKTNRELPGLARANVPELPPILPFAESGNSPPAPFAGRLLPTRNVLGNAGSPRGARC